MKLLHILLVDVMVTTLMEQSLTFRYLLHNHLKHPSLKVIIYQNIITIIHLHVRTTHMLPMAKHIRIMTTMLQIQVCLMCE